MLSASNGNRNSLNAEKKKKLTTPFRKLRVLNMFLKLLLSIFKKVNVD